MAAEDSMTDAQLDAIRELVDQYEIVGVSRMIPLGTRCVLVACFACDTGEPVEIDRFRIMPNGLTLGVLPGNPSSDQPIPYPVAC